MEQREGSALNQGHSALASVFGCGHIPRYHVQIDHGGGPSRQYCTTGPSSTKVRLSSAPSRASSAIWETSASEAEG